MNNIWILNEEQDRVDEDLHWSVTCHASTYWHKLKTCCARLQRFHIQIFSSYAWFQPVCVTYVIRRRKVINLFGEKRTRTWLLACQSDDSIRTDGHANLGILQYRTYAPGLCYKSMLKRSSKNPKQAFERALYRMAGSILAMLTDIYTIESVAPQPLSTAIAADPGLHLDQWDMWVSLGIARNTQLTCEMEVETLPGDERAYRCDSGSCVLPWRASHR